jgi:hypothetical protein
MQRAGSCPNSFVGREPVVIPVRDADVATNTGRPGVVRLT